MATKFRIHPAIGIARLGNSPTSFCIAPDAAGVFPIDCDQDGNPIVKDGKEVPVSQVQGRQGPNPPPGGALPRLRLRRRLARRARARDRRHRRHRQPELRPAAHRTDRRHPVDRLPRQQEGELVRVQGDRRRARLCGRIIRCATPTSPTRTSASSSSSIPARAACSFKHRQARAAPTSPPPAAAAPTNFPPPLAPNSIATLGRAHLHPAGQPQPAPGARRVRQFRHDEVGLRQSQDRIFANNDGWFDDVADGPVTATVASR